MGQDRENRESLPLAEEGDALEQPPTVGETSGAGVAASNQPEQAADEIDSERQFEELLETDQKDERKVSLRLIVPWLSVPVLAILWYYIDRIYS